MKKILILAAVAAAVSFGSCSKESKATEESENSIANKIEHCTNPDSLSVYVEQAKAYADKLVQEGKVDEAKRYLDELTPVVEKHAPSLAGTFATIKSTLGQVPDAAKAAADSVQCAATDSLASKAEAAKDAVSDAASAAVEAGKAKAADAASQAADKASQAADKAGQAIQGSAEKATDAIKNALK